MRFGWLNVGAGRGGWKRSAIRLGVIAVVTYMVVVIVTAVFQRHLIYFPSRNLEGLPTDVGLKYEDLSLRTSDGVRIHGWYVPRADALATILFCHGNAGNVSHRLDKLKILSTLGFNVVMFDYRGYGRSEGKPDETGLYLDAQAAWDDLVSRGEDPKRIVLAGESLGGAVAIELATQVEPLAVVVESTFTSLADVGKKHYPLLPVRWVIGDQYQSSDKIGLVKCPVLIFHGAEDELVPISMARSLFDAAPQPKRFIETPGGHNDAGFSYTPDYAKMLRQFVEEAISTTIQ
jgi:fermentation-respiration switch protein FrsA (DUF1100 family)